MGVDWIPCRADAGYSNEYLGELVRREAARFRCGGNSFARFLDPRIACSDAERARVEQAYLEFGPLYEKLLFKNESHRIYVITWEELFPVEWRIDAERTILPWELGELLARWNGYRQEVSKGQHRPFLKQLYVFNSIRELVQVDLTNFISVVSGSVNATGGWAKHPEVAACRQAILAEPIITLPLPPSWAAKDGTLELPLFDDAFSKLKSWITEWNSVVRRGNVRLAVPKPPLDFEKWVESRLNADWYESFLVWVKPWCQGGYGLYRDCEGESAIT